MWQILTCEILIWTYIAVVIIRSRDIPVSLSQTYYDGYGGWFSVLCSVCAFLLVSGMLDLTWDENWQVLGFLAGAGLLFVGTAAKFLESIEYSVHMTGAITLVFATQIWVYLFCNPAALLVWLTAILWYRKPQVVFYCEAVSALSVLLGVLLK